MAQSNDVMDLKEVRSRAEDELRQLVHSKRVSLREARFARQLGQLSKTHVLKQMRRDIARLETVLGGRKHNNEVKS